MAAGNLSLTSSTGPEAEVGETFELLATYGDPDDRNVAFRLPGRDLQGNPVSADLVVGAHDSVVLGPLVCDDPDVTIEPDPSRPMVWHVTLLPRA